MANVCPGASVVAYALMAAGGDLGAAFGPQLVGVMTDFSGASEGVAIIANRLGITAEVLGMKGSMFISSIFPILASVVFLIFQKMEKQKNCHDL